MFQKSLLLKPAAMRTRSQRSQRSDGSHELAPLSLSSLPEAVLEHALTFVDEYDDARCRAISQSWARLRRVWILPYPKIGRDQCGEVMAVAFSPDGSLLAVGAKEHPPVKLYDVATGDLRRALSRGDQGDDKNWRHHALSLAFTPDGTEIATGCHGNISVYNVATGESSELWRSVEKYYSTPHVNYVAFSPDGSTFAFCREHMGGRTAAAILGIGGWTRSPRVLTVPARADGEIEGMAFSPTGSALVVGVGTTLKFFDVTTGEQGLEIECHVSISSVAYSSRGIWAVGGSRGELKLFEPPEDAPDDYDEAVPLRLNHGGVHDGRRRSLQTLCFSRDGSTFAANGCYGGTYVDIYDTETGDLRHQLFRLKSYSVKAAAFSPDGKSIALGESVSFRSGGRVSLYDTTTGDLRRMHRQSQAPTAPPPA